MVQRKWKGMARLRQLEIEEPMNFPLHETFCLVGLIYYNSVPVVLVMIIPILEDTMQKFSIHMVKENKKENEAFSSIWPCSPWYELRNLNVVDLPLTPKLILM